MQSETMLTMPSNAAGAGQHQPSDRPVPLLSGPKGRLLSACLRSLERSGLLWRMNFTITGAFRTHAVRIPVIFGVGLEHTPMAEVWLFDALKKVLPRRPGTVIDV